MATDEKPAGLPMRDSVREAIRTLVIDGELRPGDRLVERQLADRLGVSRVPVREALRELAHEGLAEQRPTRGMVVRQLDDEAIEELFEVRAALEAIVCRRVVDRATEEGLDRLDATVAQADAAIAEEVSASQFTRTPTSTRCCSSSRTVRSSLLSWHPWPAACGGCSASTRTRRR
jgi:DNA-binding GntR family transcriptional regulator